MYVCMCSYACMHVTMIYIYMYMYIYLYMLVKKSSKILRKSHRPFSSSDHMLMGSANFPCFALILCVLCSHAYIFRGVTKSFFFRRDAASECARGIPETEPYSIVMEHTRRTGSGRFLQHPGIESLHDSETEKYITVRFCNIAKQAQLPIHGHDHQPR